MTMNSKKLMPVFENGMAQPVFPFTDGKTGDAYDATVSYTHLTLPTNSRV